MKYSVGQKVKIRSLEWYRDNVNRYGIIECGKYVFFEPMNEYCGKVVTIKRIDDDNYRIDTDKGAFCWTDEMIEGLVEEETTLEPKFKKGDCVKCSDDSIGIIVDCDWVESKESYLYYIDYIGTLDAGYQLEKDLQPHTITTMNGRDIFEGAKWKHEFECPNGYIFKDENGNVINATKIVLEKKKKEYPKTYCECKDILGLWDIDDTELGYYKTDLIDKLQMLLICRDAYWKLYGEEMRLGKPWSPSDNNKKPIHAITRYDGYIIKDESGGNDEVLEFPTEEMRDTFYENFKELIEQCKELL